MLTANDIREVLFSKSMGGYKTAEVDAFLDQCADTVEELTNTGEENARKMQVLAETVVDYRNQEDSIRTALISAQRMAETVVKEAQEKADALVKEAQEKADAIVAEADERAANARDDANKSIAAEQEELSRVRKDVAAFKARLMAIYREHLTLIGVLEGDEEPEVPAAQPDDSSKTPAEEPAEAEQPEEAPVEEDKSDTGSKPFAFDLAPFEIQEEE